VRGDLEINEVKLSNLSNLTNLKQMSEEEAKKYNIISGYTGPYKLNTEILSIADDSLSGSVNLIGGANEEDNHYKNLNFERDWEANIFGDIKLATEGSLCNMCGKKLERKRGIELGHVFKLGKLYSEKFNIKIAGPDQQSIIPIMGCYGIGIDRILACASENKITENSLNWPISISPYNIHIVDLNKNVTNKKISDSIEKISQHGISVLLDDREETPGKKFADADLIGIPIKIILSDRNLKNNEVEIVNRSSNETMYAPIETFYDDAIILYDQLMKECSI
jgi:prolyl-tRNA synthetase